MLNTFGNRSVWPINQIIHVLVDNARKLERFRRFSRFAAAQWRQRTSKSEGGGRGWGEIAQFKLKPSDSSCGGGCKAKNVRVKISHMNLPQNLEGRM